MPYRLSFLEWLRWEFTSRDGWDRSDQQSDPVIAFAHFVLFENETLGNMLQRSADTLEPQDIAHQLKRRKASPELMSAFVQTWREFINLRTELDLGLTRYRKQYELRRQDKRAA